MDLPCILFALSREAMYFRRWQFRPPRRFVGAPCRACLCHGVPYRAIVLETGVGTARTEKALEWLRRGPALGNTSFRPRFVLSAGFSGALQESVRVGDVLLASEVADPEGNCWPTTWPPAGANPQFARARLLTVTELIGDPAVKRQLGAQHGAAAADMETAAVARWCRQHGMPFGALRAVSDDVDTALSPRLVGLLSGGRVSSLRVLAALAAAPSLAGEFWRLARQTRLAARRLAAALGQLLWGGRGPVKA